MSTFGGVNGVQGQVQTPQISLIDQRLGEEVASRRLPSSLLLTHAVEYFNLNEDPRWPSLPVSVKWQLLHAASASKTADGIQLSSGEFGIDHLSLNDLAVLYRVLKSYHVSRELPLLGQNAIFKAHLELIETRLTKIAQDDVQAGRSAITALRSLEDESVAPLAMKLEAILNGTASKSLIDSKLDQVIKTVLQEMERCQVKATYPSGLLLLFADQHYNLRSNPNLPVILPDEVKWQLLHAATAYKDDTKIIRLGENFSYEHLSHEHVAILLMVLTSYHEMLEKTAKGSDAIFQKHLFMMETHLELLCWKNPTEGIRALTALKATCNPVLNPIIEKLEKIFLVRERYLSVLNTFENNPFLAGVFNAQSPDKLKGVLDANGPKAVMIQVKANYHNFIKWMKTISDMEAAEKDPVVQKAVRKWKSEIQDRFFAKHFNLICQICDAYPSQFKNTFARWNSLAILNDGARIIMDKFIKKGEIKGIPVICSSYEDYRDKLREIANSSLQNGVWQVSIRCEKSQPHEYGVHQTGAYVEKINGQVFVQILDASTYDFDNGPYKVAGLSRESAPGSVLNSTMVVRQRDLSNCAYFMFNDMRAISKNPLNIQWLRGASVNILEYVKGKSPDAISYWHQKAPQAMKDVMVTPDVPLDFITPAQSLSQIAAAIKSPKGPITPGSIEKLQERVRRYKLTELSQDSAVIGSDVTGFVKLRAMKLRLEVAIETFTR